MGLNFQGLNPFSDWDPVGDIEDAISWTGDFLEGSAETFGLKETEATKKQASLAKTLAAKNADMIIKAGVKEMGALSRDYEYESTNLLLDAQAMLDNTSMSVSTAAKERNLAMELEEDAMYTELDAYRADYKNVVAKVDTQAAIDQRSAITSRISRTSSAKTTFDVTMGRAELDLNNDVLLAELIANETISQAALTRTQVGNKTVLLTELSIAESEAEYGQAERSAAVEFAAVGREAGSLFKSRVMAAELVAKYRTETELAKTIYEAVHTVASTKARLGASGFSGESGAIVSKDLQDFYGGQITALQSNINAELSLTLDNAQSSYTNTLTSATERNLLETTWAAEVLSLTKHRAVSTQNLALSQANQDYKAAVDIATNRQGLTEGIAISTFGQTTDAASAIKANAISDANLVFDTSQKNTLAVSNTSKTIAENTFNANANKVVQAHEGRVSTLDLNFETFQAEKQAATEQYMAKYEGAKDYQKDVYESEVEWTGWAAQQEAMIAVNQGDITASSIKDQAASSRFSRVATTVGTAIALA